MKEIFADGERLEKHRQETEKQRRGHVVDDAAY